MKKPRILKIQKEASNPWFEQVKKTVVFPGDSREKTFYSIKPSDVVNILAQTKEGKVILVKQYRSVVDDFTFELPGGHLDKGETPGQAIVREFKEETNCIARDVTLLGEIVPDTGRLENRLSSFYSGNVEVNKFPDPAENDGIEVCLVTLEELLEMMNTGKLNHAQDLCGIALAVSKKFLRI